MPKNPSERQKAASRRNLKGNEGPKTEEGKRRSSENGRLNRGPKTAKAHSLILLARHGPNTDTFYAEAGCVDCTMTCRWPSFSLRTPASDLPLACFEELLRPKPDLCFYNVQGMCTIAFDVPGTRDARHACILEPQAVDVVFEGLPSPHRGRAELMHRRVSVGFKKEVDRYVREARIAGVWEFPWTPRKIYVMRWFRRVLLGGKFCSLETGRTRSDWDSVIRWLAYDAEL